MTGMNTRRPLGPGGPTVAPFALGTMTFAAETDEPEAHRLLDVFVERGGNLIDTADAYSNGDSEAFIGRWLAKCSTNDDVIIATKGRFNPPPGSPGGVAAQPRALGRPQSATPRS